MDNFLVSLKGSYSIVLLAVIATYALCYVDSKITGKKLDSNNYLKVAMLSIIISSSVVYIHTLDIRIDDEIISGPVPF